MLAQLSRYAVVLVPPEHTEALGLHRSSSGLMLYIDGEDMEHPAGLEGAMTLIEDEVGIEVTLVEHRSDLTYWTAIPRSAHHG